MLRDLGKFLLSSTSLFNWVFVILGGIVTIALAIINHPLFFASVVFYVCFFFIYINLGFAKWRVQNSWSTFLSRFLEDRFAKVKYPNGKIILALLIELDIERREEEFVLLMSLPDFSSMRAVRYKTVSLRHFKSYFDTSTSIPVPDAFILIWETLKETGSDMIAWGSLQELLQNRAVFIAKRFAK